MKLDKNYKLECCFVDCVTLPTAQNGCLARDQNLPRSNFFPGLKIATFGAKMLGLFLKIILAVFCELCPVSLYKII